MADTITSKLPDLQELVASTDIAASLRTILGGEQSMNFSVSIDQGGTSFNFSISNSSGQSESYSKRVPYSAPNLETPSGPA